MPIAFDPAAYVPALPPIGNVILGVRNLFIKTIATEALRYGGAFATIALTGIALSPSTIRPYTAPLLAPLVVAGATVSLAALAVKKFF